MMMSCILFQQLILHIKLQTGTNVLSSCCFFYYFFEIEIIKLLDFSFIYFNFLQQTMWTFMLWFTNSVFFFFCLNLFLLFNCSFLLIKYFSPFLGISPLLFNADLVSHYRRYLNPMDPRMLIGNNGITDLNKPCVKGNVKHLNICFPKKNIILWPNSTADKNLKDLILKMHSWVINQSQYNIFLFRYLFN